MYKCESWTIKKVEHQRIYASKCCAGEDMCTPMFISALFIIARTWKQPRCPLADKWIRKLWHIYTMEYYWAIKKNAFESVLMRWVKLEPIIQCKVSQSERLFCSSSLQLFILISLFLLIHLYWLLLIIVHTFLLCLLANSSMRNILKLKILGVRYLCSSTDTLELCFFYFEIDWSIWSFL